MNLLKTIAALMIFAALALLPARAATTMSVVSLTQGVYTDLGAGPMYLSAVRGNIVYQIADSANTALPAFSLTQNDPPRAISSTSHVFALALSASTTQALIASGSGISFAGSGGGGGGSVTQGTTPWVGSLTVGGSAMSTTNGLFVNPATGATFPISGSVSLAGGSATIGNVVEAPSSSSSLAVLHAPTPALASSLIAKAAAGNLYSYNCTAITGGAAGYCVAYNSATVPSTGALTGAQVLDVCYFGATAGGCSLSHGRVPANYSTGIVILVTSAATPFTYTTGVDTAFISADYF